MAKKMDGKELGLVTLLGTSVVILTPILTGFVSGIGFMATEIIPGVIDIGTALAAGTSAWISSFVIDKWLR